MVIGSGCDGGGGDEACGTESQCGEGVRLYGKKGESGSDFRGREKRMG